MSAGDGTHPIGVAILGATGSIGRSALRVVDQHPDRFRVVALSAHRHVAELATLAERYRPELAVLADPAASASSPTAPIPGVRWAVGADALLEAASLPSAAVVLDALLGAAGLGSTLAALGAGKRVALANKESLVCGGELVMAAARAGGGSLFPVDSEHSALAQCLRAGSADEVERLVLTASGGPFRTWSTERIAAASVDDALRHPTWSMGAKITVDSATLANKALETIEAHHLFGVGYDRIAAVVHPQSIVHSWVEWRDGSVVAQLGCPSMELPILYALADAERPPYPARRWDPVGQGALTFEALRADAFPAFGLGVDAGRAGGLAPAVYNAANEVAVAAFLAGGLAFGGIPATLDHVLGRWGGGAMDSVDAVWSADRWARREADNFIGSGRC